MVVILVGSLIGKAPKALRRFVVPFCKSYVGYPLTFDETKLLSEIMKIFDNIREPEDLDRCLLCWQITHDSKYMDIIKQHALNQTSPVHKPADFIINHYIRSTHN